MFFALTPEHNPINTAALYLGLQQAQELIACHGPKGLSEIMIVLARASRAKAMDHSVQCQIT